MFSDNPTADKKTNKNVFNIEQRICNLIKTLEPLFIIIIVVKRERKRGPGKYFSMLLRIYESRNIKY